MKMKIHPIEALKTVIVFVASVFRETDGNGGGKASFNRVAGAYVIVQIVAMSWVALLNVTYKVPEAMMTLFWVLIGYGIVSKILNSLTPAVLDIAKGFLLKAGVKIETPTPSGEVKQ